MTCTSLKILFIHDLIAQKLMEINLVFVLNSTNIHGNKSRKVMTQKIVRQKISDNFKIFALSDELLSLVAS